MSDGNPSRNLLFHSPSTADGILLYNLVKSSPPLDLNSAYYYAIFCTHFGKTSLVAKDNDKIVAFVTGYFLPDEPDVLFIWQVCVDSDYRGEGLALDLIIDLVFRAAPKKIKTTITPSNKASLNLFKSLSSSLNAKFSYEKPFFTCDEIDGNESEWLFEIAL